jgi:2-polyprenyl-6-methoxyphenol hydroxylase-like FAD-dependent oxidoreductase
MSGTRQRSFAVSRTGFHVAIVGGGIGGLCLAQGLKKSGLSVAVYERDRTRTDRLQGYRIHIDPRGSRALHECLPPRLYEAFAAGIGRSGGGYGFFDERLRELLFVESDGASGKPDRVDSHKSVSRIALRQVLLAGLEDLVHLGKEFVGYVEAPDGSIVARFEDGTSATGDVLVGADGGNSRVRKQLLPQAERADTDILAVAGKVALNEEVRALLPPKLFVGPASVMAPKGLGMFVAVHEFERGTVRSEGAVAVDGPAGRTEGLLFDDTRDYVMWAFTARREKYGLRLAPECMDGPALQDVVLGMTGGWHPRLRELVRRSDPSTVTPLPIRSSVPVEPWETRNVTLIGDAIHSMTPMRGIGANVALRDAALLRANLVAADQNEKPLLAAIRDYEGEMVRYGFDAVRSSMKAAEQATSENAVALAVAKSAFRLMNAVPPLKRLAFGGMGDGRRRASLAVAMMPRVRRGCAHASRGSE